jgi:drug/metabolite transporter (DMT)-like permease
MKRYFQVYVLLFIAIVFSVSGEILLKLGIDIVNEQVGAFSADLKTLWITFTNWRVLLGFTLIFGSSIFWLGVISRADFSFAYPLLSLSYVAALVPAYFILGENISLQRWIGAIIVVVGAIVIGWEPKQSAQAKAE